MHGETPLRDWLALYEYRNILSLHGHWSDHKGEFSELGSAEEYEARANRFVNSFSNDSEIEYMRLRDLSIYLYKHTSNEFAIVGAQGNVMVSYFKPEDKIRYWQRVKMRNLRSGAILDEGHGGTER